MEPQSHPVGEAVTPRPGELLSNPCRIRVGARIACDPGRWRLA
jgi:hypothetical protein